MEASWSQRFHDLTPEAQLVVRACAVLRRIPLSQHSAAAASASPVSRAGGVFAALADAGWGEVVDDQGDIYFDVDLSSSAFLYRLVRQTPLDDIHEIIERTAASLENLVASAAPLSPVVRSSVLGVLRAANWYDRPLVALKLARSVWESFTLAPGGVDAAGSGIDLGWWRAVAEEGEQAASRTRQPRLLADLLDRSARLYSAVGNWQGAEAAWIRALYLMNRLGDRDEYDRYLELLATTYHDAGQATAFVTTLEELVDRYEREDKPDQAASALTRIGTTLLGTGQYVSAIRHFGQADRLLTGLANTTDRQIRRAEILSDMGRAHAGLGAINRARTCYRDALALVVDVDQDAERRVRDLQASLPEQQL